MPNANEYSLEQIGQMIAQLNKNHSEAMDLLQYIILNSEESELRQKLVEEKLNTISNDVDTVKKTTEDINTKMDLVLQSLSRVESRFSEYKNEVRDDEQKICLMNNELKNAENEIDDADFQSYYALSEQIYTNWIYFDELTKKLIPTAEYLFSKMQNYKMLDFSPVVLEFCRALENEFLEKIFKKYTLDVIERYSNKNDLDVFLSSDRAFCTDHTQQFVKAIAKAYRTNKPEYTLGQMQFVLNRMNDRSVIKMSPLLQDFDKYLKKETNRKDFLEPSFIESIDEIVNKYRNPSAHPDKMDLKSAQRCKNMIPTKIDYLIDCTLN